MNFDNYLRFRVSGNSGEADIIFLYDGRIQAVEIHKEDEFVVES